MKRILLWLNLLFALSPVFSQEAKRADEIDRIEAELKWMTGRVVLGNDLAELNLTNDYRYLDKEDARKVIVDLWGNPASRGDTLGMIFPADLQPSQRGSWGVVISYREDGYVKDDDAAKTNYDDLMKQMQDAVKQDSESRVKQNFPKVELIGWADRPHYDQQTHKLYWAKEFAFGGDAIHTLNYDVRVLGRKGVLVINAVAPISELPTIQEQMPQIISMVNFSPGNRYADYQQGNDKVATYGLAALILGGVAAKAGLFKGLIALIIAGKKFIIIAAIAVAGFVVRLFRKIKKSKVESVTDPASSHPLLRKPPGQD